MTAPTEPMPSAARHFIDGLQEAGIDWLFCNLGTDHVSLVDELARAEMEGRAAPRVLLCPHENVAVHMAGGYAALTGRGQGVLVHVDAGTANAAMGLHNLMRGRLPVMLMAGRAPYALHGELPGARDNYVHYVQDLFDMGSLVRPYVKWEYNLPSGVVAKEVIRRGHTLMQSDPPGPVYLTLPRETLAEPVAAVYARSYPAQRYGATGSGTVPREAALEIARALMGAEHPLVVTSYLGRSAQAVRALEALAQLCGLRVVESNPSWLCMDRGSPCFAGFDAQALLPQTDLGLLLDVDVPWLPGGAQPREDSRWLHIDVDPVKKDFPVWGFATDGRWQADCARALRDIHEAVQSLANADFHARVAQRKAGWLAVRQARIDRTAAGAADPGQADALNPAWVCAVLGRHLRPQDVLVNEGIRNGPHVLAQIPRSQPLTLLGGAGGGLGYSAGMALGARLALQDAGSQARVVHVEGDGGFHFSTPSSVYAVAQQYRLPILSVVLDNGGWQAVKEAVLRVYPDGAAAQADEYQSRLQGAVRQFEQVGQAFGAYGECLRDPAQADAAVARCLRALDEGRSAVLNVQIGLQ